MKLTSAPISCDSSPETSSQEKPSHAAVSSSSLMNLLWLPLQDFEAPGALLDLSSSALPYPGPLYCPPGHQAINGELFCVIPESPVTSDSNIDDCINVSQQQQQGAHQEEELEPIPIHPRFFNSSNEMEHIAAPAPTSSPLPCVNSVFNSMVAQPSQCNVDITIKSTQQHGEHAFSLAGSKRQVVASAGAPETPFTRPSKRSCIRRVSTCSSSNNDEVRAPRFRNYQEKQWMELFDQLLKFKDAKGHCLVPHTYPENAPLSRWVKRQRYQYKLKKENMVSTMTQSRIEMLENIGFVWDSHAVAWEEHRLELVAFKSSHGHCDVPSSYKKPSLATWVKRQRRQKKLLCSGQKSTMTMERYALLERMGFSWEVKNVNKKSSR